ncbi:uncharacterized protein LOC128111813 [Peromyscus californicus insignis]|uniref:uncharacterized protein LOC128111813 n=1 Tax=Peromyscus californicus insignis TaxID=564181 RepID=UPI0022A774FE|nr:uncharacterized protein LOC128111813 [Peromyscus californicus insignis]
MVIVRQSHLGSGQFHSLCKTGLGSLATDLVFSFLLCLNPISRHAGSHARPPGAFRGYCHCRGLAAALYCPREAGTSPDLRPQPSPSLPKPGLLREAGLLGETSESLEGFQKWKPSFRQRGSKAKSPGDPGQGHFRGSRMFLSHHVESVCNGSILETKEKKAEAWLMVVAMSGGGKGHIGAPGMPKFRRLQVTAAQHHVQGWPCPAGGGGLSADGFRTIVKPEEPKQDPGTQRRGLLFQTQHGMAGSWIRNDCC